MKQILKLIRIKDWIKNILIFLPLICSGSINTKDIIDLLFAFISFSLLSSSIYIINDINDQEKDRKHPIKKHRPIASGKITKTEAIIILIILLTFSLGLNILINKNIFNYEILFLLAYLFINIFYSFGLKNIPILEILLLITGFIIRIFYGAYVVNIEVSSWLFLTSLSASMFLGLSKRKNELKYNKEARKVLSLYNESFLKDYTNISLALTIVFYSLWTIEKNNKNLVFTVPLLIIIFMKYSLNTETNKEENPTTILYNDKYLILLCILYGIIMIILLVM